MPHWSEPQQSVVSPIDAIAEVDRQIKGIEDEKKRRTLNKIDTMFPDTGPLRRDLYPRHTEFMRAGKYYRSRLFSAGNRTGKTTTGGFEMAVHLTGLYPKWWQGRVFEETGNYWAAGTSNETTKGIVQSELLGKLEKDDSVSESLLGMGTGMIPAHLIAGVEFHAQIRGAIKTAWIKHVSGKRNTLSFKSFEQGSTAFEGISVLGSWLDESPSLEIYTEVLMRSLTTDGIVLITATPLNGLTDLVMQFMPDGVIPDTQIPC